MNFYFNPHYQDKPLVVDLGNIYIKVENYSPWVAPNPSDYDYNSGDWNLYRAQFIINGKFPEAGWRSLDDDVFFLKTLELNQPHFNHLIISTLLQ